MLLGGVALLAVAAGALSLAWGVTKRADLAQAQEQLMTTQASLAKLNTDLSSQAQRYRQLEHSMASVMAKFAQNKAQLTKADAQLLQAQSQVDQAQSQVDQAQSQLNSTQHNLSVTQAHATDCQLGSTLGQQTVQLLASVNLSEISYLNAAQSQNVHLMQSDIGQMRSLLQEEQSLGPKFASAVTRCTDS